MGDAMQCTAWGDQRPLDAFPHRTAILIPPPLHTEVIDVCNRHMGRATVYKKGSLYVLAIHTPSFKGRDTTTDLLGPDLVHQLCDQSVCGRFEL